MPKTIHQGRNVKRFREMLGIKQEALALDLGDDWNQKKISLLEQKEVIEPGLLQQIADALKVPADAIKNFDEEVAVNIIANTFDNGSIGYQKNERCNINPIDKWIEALEENRKLYERLLKEKEEKITLLERMLGEGKKK
ncbi:MAG: XRE family transcriptional regulator [Chitinophagaceae bacterium]|nr:MAG: XRE family transcriptional regulator [Chitinophagaceae bacterium]